MIRRSLIYRALKVVLVIILAIVLFQSLAAKRMSHTSFPKMEKTMMKVVNTSQTKAGNSQIVRRLYSLNPEDYDGIMLYYPSSTMSANELLVVKLKSMKQQDLVVDCIKTRNQTQKNSFKGYGATQTKLLENSISEVRGNYILYVVDEHAATIRDTFVKAL